MRWWRPWRWRDTGSASACTGTRRGTMPRGCSPHWSKRRASPPRNPPRNPPTSLRRRRRLQRGRLAVEPVALQPDDRRRPRPGYLEDADDDQQGPADPADRPRVTAEEPEHVHCALEGYRDDEERDAEAKPVDESQ